MKTEQLEQWQPVGGGGFCYTAVNTAVALQDLEKIRAHKSDLGGVRDDEIQ